LISKLSGENSPARLAGLFFIVARRLRRSARLTAPTPDAGTAWMHMRVNTKRAQDKLLRSADFQIRWARDVQRRRVWPKVCGLEIRDIAGRNPALRPENFVLRP